MKNYVKLECLGYVLPQELSVGYLEWPHTKIKLSMGKTVGELHVMLIEYEKGLPKKAETPQVMMIKGDKIQKSNKKSLKAKGKGLSAYLDELIKKNKQVSTASSSDVFIIELFSFSTKSWVYDTSCGTHICNTKHSLGGVRKLKQVEAIGSYDFVLPNGLVICLDNCHYAPSILRGVVSVHHLVENRFVQCFTDFGILVSKNNVHYFNVIPSNGVYEIDMHNLVPNVNSIYNVSTKRAKHNLDSTYLWHCHLAHISKKRIKKLQQEGLLNNSDESLINGVSLSVLSAQMCGENGPQLTPPYTPQHNRVSERRNRTLLDMVRSMMNLTTLPLSFWDYALEFATRILNMVPTKKVDKTPYELWHAEFFEKNLITQEVSERAIEEDIPIRRSERTRRAPNHLCLNVEAEEHSLGDLNEPTSYKATMLDSESNKWIDAMNAKIQSMMDNMQASRSWNKRFDEEIKRFGFAQNLDEPCVYQKASGSNVTFLILYVDDIIIMGNHIPSLQSVKDYLGKCFSMKDLGEAAFILGIKIYRDRSKRLIGLGQNAYMDKILKRYRMDNSKRGHIPMQERLDLNKTQGASTPEEVKRMQNVPYASAVGSIINPEAELRVNCYCNTGFEIDIDDMKSLT
ncbi:retrotransposon protein, putative, ty1-copia subclass [Tanacetum coccineum]